MIAWDRTFEQALAHLKRRYGTSAPQKTSDRAPLLASASLARGGDFSRARSFKDGSRKFSSGVSGFPANRTCGASLSPPYPLANYSFADIFAGEMRAQCVIG